MQEALSYLQAMGAVSKLPDDVQWSIRALLMRRLPNVAMLPRISAPAPGTDPALPQLLGYLLQQMSKVMRRFHAPYKFLANQNHIHQPCLRLRLPYISSS